MHYASPPIRGWERYVGLPGEPVYPLKNSQPHSCFVLVAGTGHKHKPSLPVHRRRPPLPPWWRTTTTVARGGGGARPPPACPLLPQPLCPPLIRGTRGGATRQDIGMRTRRPLRHKCPESSCPHPRVHRPEKLVFPPDVSVRELQSSGARGGFLSVAPLALSMLGCVRSSVR